MADFASRLRELRVRRGLRQKDLASALGLAQTTIANYEQKLRFPDESTLVKIADYFTVSFDELMGRDNDSSAGFSAPSEEKPLSGLALDYLHALRTGGRKAALSLLQGGAFRGTGIRDLYLHVFEPALREVGRLWSLGELAVGEEHAFSEATQALMSQLYGETEAGAAGTGRRCISLSGGGESHVIGVRMISDFLSLSGWDVRFLGGHLSIRHVREHLLADPPDLLALSVTLPENRDSAADLIRAIRAEKPLRALKIMAGGQAFRDHPCGWKDIGADGTAVNAEEAVKVAEDLVGGKSQGPPSGTGRCAG
jgi:MerR family transcriptional regulator, light-induced transcriptional regulator